MQGRYQSASPGEVDIDFISRGEAKYFTFFFQLHELRNSFGEDMLFSQGLEKLGWARGMPVVSSEEPRLNLGGDPFFTDGLLLVLLFDRRPISMLEVQFFDW